MVKKFIGHTYNFFSCLFHRIKGKKRTIFIGPHTRIKNPSKICLFSDVILGRYGYLSVHSKNGNISIGERTNIGMFFQIACLSSVKIGKDCLFAANCYIADFTHEYKDINKPISKQRIYVKQKVGGGGGIKNDVEGVTIGDACWIGRNVVIIGNLSIGRHCIIGANSFVNSSLPEYSVCVGQPARVIKRFDFNLKEWVSV